MQTRTPSEQVAHLQTLPQHPQRSSAWYTARDGKITASAAATFLCKDDKTVDPYLQEFGITDFKKDPKASANPYQDRNDTIHEKATGSRTFFGNISTFWGQKYEPVASDIYASKNKTQVLEFGLIPHPSIPFLAASPDGITPDGTMIEIKCPYRRKITGIPPFYYWIQVQLQLEVCDLEAADFVECEFVEYCTVGEFLDDALEPHSIERKGLFLQIDPIPDDNPERRKYIYPPSELASGPLSALLEWERNTIAQLDVSNTEILRTVYWKLVVYSCARIVRNRPWFAAILPDLRAASEEIAAKKKQLSSLQSLGSSSYSHSHSNNRNNNNNTHNNNNNNSNNNSHNNRSKGYGNNKSLSRQFCLLDDEE